jgi:tyrosyl-tRNA synthetase
MSMIELLGLLRTTTAAQMLERDDFAKRWAASEPISMLELLYPLLQGYDSVAVASDVELGGTDQKFNLLLGRDIQRAYGRPEQAILTMPILVGTDGRRKMSKSFGNHIGITDPPNEIYGKTMSLPDDAMDEYFRLLLDEESRPAGATAMQAKRALARGLVEMLYDAEQAAAAEAHFNRVIVDQQEPEEITDAAVRAVDGSVHLPAVIAQEFGISRSEARRLIDQGAVTLSEAPLEPGEHDLPVERLDGQVLKVGKRRFRRLRAS